MENINRYFDVLAAFFLERLPRLLVSTFEAIAAGEPTSQDLVVALAFVLIVLALVLLGLMFLRGLGKPKFSESLTNMTRWPRRIGFTVIVIFLGGFAVWAYYAPLSSAALATGVVSPDGSRKTVQHLEGGIVETIHVREGDRVEAGDTLITLENVRALARYEELRERMVFLLATEARLQSEEAGLDKIVFPEDLLEDERLDARLMLLSQQALFDNRRETQAARERILTSRIDQLHEEIRGLEEVILAQDDQLDLFSQELEAAESLNERGLQRLPQLLALKRQFAGLQAQRAQNRSSIARLEQQIGEAELQILATRQQALEKISSEKAEIGAQLAGVRSQLPEREDALARTVVTAPISGRILNVRVTTERSGILRSGGEVLDIVPEEIDLIVDARVRPQDIENIYPGMSARVILTAYNQRNLPQLFGILDTVSADRLVDDRTGEPYYLAKIHVDADDLAKIGDDIELIAGMPAEVMLLTGDRTLFDFLLKPFVDSIRRSFRET